ncbi:hypothetical protein CHS0354_031816 [Potamilus streckersoni]|uniref:Sorting nexin-14 n=1 Tax=Potamilus streckersoni TaxID=2493646 RepID=A0AAE0RXS0_9BIVA|nr:hypothetical protein CHS0354_031816 [Potamilus streckersoni]
MKNIIYQHIKFTSFVGILFIFTFVFYSYINIFLAIWSFLFGVIVAYSFLSVDFLMPNLLFMYSRNKKAKFEDDDELALMKTFCTVCGQRKCPRHRPELNILAFQPWTGLEVRKKVDEAAEEFLDTVLNEFVYTWYRNLSTDEEFVDELRSSIRYLASIFLRKAKRLDVAKLVVDKLLKAGLQHLHMCLKAKKSLEPGRDLQDSVIDVLGPNLHYAMYSRKAELEYLRRLVEKLFPFILSPQAQMSRSMCSLVREILAGSLLLPAMDAVANPDMVNNLILLFLDDTPPPVATEPLSPMVPFLGHFTSQPKVKLSDPDQTEKTHKSCLRLVLGDAMDPEKPHMLYPFMQFMKKEAAVNVLQFALSCEEFNKRILNPELSQSELVALHNSAKELYHNYCSPLALDRIKFEESIVEELRDIIEGLPHHVIRLRTSTPLFKAYEHVYNLLSKTFLPLYHQSEEYYIMLCGDRVETQTRCRSTANYLYVPKSTTNIPSNARQQKKREFNIISIGSKLKEVFKPSSSLDLKSSEDMQEDADTVTITSNSSIEDEVVSAQDSHEENQEIHPHDLSTLRVSIPRLGARPEPDNPHKQFYVFIVDVRRVDMATEGRSHWTVPRRYHEFYVLEQKLKEFHGDFTGRMLPSKKVIGTKKQDFIDSMREPFEKYLQDLLTRPQLKGSQLLYNFLTSETDFSTGFDINLGKIIRSVAMKVLEEKGQHLETFLQAFETSTEAPKPRPSKQERRGSDASFQSTSSEKLCASIYENNGEGLSRSTTDDELSDVTECVEIEGIFDTIIYVARYVYQVPNWVHHVLLSGRMLFKQTLESYLDWYIDKKVEQVTQEHRLVGLIHLLQHVLFIDNDPPRTDEQKKERYETTLKASQQFIPGVIVSVVGHKNHEAGTKLLLEFLQQPKLNKQLSYVFLDIVIQELFPELKN